MDTGNLCASARRCDLDHESSAGRNGKVIMDRDNQQSMEEIQLRILRVTDDLRIIQSELNCAAMQAPTDPELLEALSESSRMESLHVLKSVLDQMRHFLWFYMQVVTRSEERRVGEEGRS